MDLKKIEPGHIFEKAQQYIVNVLIVYIILVLVIGLFRTLVDVNMFVSGPVEGHTFSKTVTGILSFLVIIELFRGFIDFFKSNRFRLHTMMDPALIFIMRELMVSLYEHKDSDWTKLVGFGFLILCMGIVRTLAVYYSPDPEGKVSGETVE